MRVNSLALLTIICIRCTAGQTSWSAVHDSYTLRQCKIWEDTNLASQDSDITEDCPSARCYFPEARHKRALLGAINAPPTPSPPSNATYHEADALVSSLEEIVSRCAGIAKVFELGKTVLAQPIPVVQFLANGFEDSQSDLGQDLRPSVFLGAGIHGNDYAGREMLMAAVSDFCDSYSTDEQLQRMLNNTLLHIAPSLNPDGHKAGSMQNAHGFNLDRNFPDRYDAGEPLLDRSRGNYITISNVYRVLQPEKETREIVRWMELFNFDLVGLYYGGGTGVAYPPGSCSRYPVSVAGHCPTPENAYLKGLAQEYIQEQLHEEANMPYMWQTAHFEMPPGSTFPSTPGIMCRLEGGTTLLGELGAHAGSLMDWSYHELDSIAFRVHVAAQLSPPPYMLADVWQRQRPGTVQLLQQMGRALKGYILEHSTGDPIEAQVMVTSDDGQQYLAHNDLATGSYYRPLPAGEFTVVVRVLNGDEFLPQTRHVLIEEGQSLVHIFGMSTNPYVNLQMEETPSDEGGTDATLMGVAGAAVALLALIGGFLLYRWRKKRAKRHIPRAVKTALNEALRSQSSPADAPQQDGNNGGSQTAGEGPRGIGRNINSKNVPSTTAAGSTTGGTRSDGHDSSGVGGSSDDENESDVPEGGRSGFPGDVEAAQGAQPGKRGILGQLGNLKGLIWGMGGRRSGKDHRSRAPEGGPGNEGEKEVPTAETDQHVSVMEYLKAAPMSVQQELSKQGVDLSTLGPPKADKNIKELSGPTRKWKNPTSKAIGKFTQLHLPATLGGKTDSVRAIDTESPSMQRSEEDSASEEDPDSPGHVGPVKNPTLQAREHAGQLHVANPNEESEDVLDLGPARPRNLQNDMAKCGPTSSSHAAMPVLIPKRSSIGQRDFLNDHLDSSSVEEDTLSSVFKVAEHGIEPGGNINSTSRPGFAGGRHSVRYGNQKQQTTKRVAQNHVLSLGALEADDVLELRFLTIGGITRISSGIV
ncbi:hypothetical protein CYMTET_24669 [Cymbomonas tetramitiformis]|uniref:Peptidase M14 domain-containing protein n=1 Tax=Cymbomonas tetramitiformis TaxID=36881 RepID=A0AAE0KZV0_9CHLO|nr:hypothetical protein CYMTET_24669 [Cymbomonas tetramitiformis]